MIKELKIYGLFDLYDYDIELKKDGITILTGPNGYGKTTILKIILAISKLNLYDLINFPYKQIILTFDSGNTIQIDQDEKKEEITISNAKGFSKSFTKRDFISKMNILLIKKGLPYSYDPKQDSWIQRSNEQQFTFGELIDKEKLDIDPERMFGFSMENELQDNVHLIPEHRLFRVQSFRNRNFNHDDSSNQISYITTINSYSRELKEIIKTTLEKYATVSQDLDSTFPGRLFEEILSPQMNSEKG
jgi:predicted ATP-binding protein involved in virulence